MWPYGWLVGLFMIFSITDLVYHQAQGVEVFFFGSLLIAIPERPILVFLTVWLVLWGSLREIPTWLFLLSSWQPATWILTWIGYGTRTGIVGRDDLVAIGGLTCLLPWTGVVAVFTGLEVWRIAAGSSVYAGKQKIPAFPGILLGLVVFVGWTLIFD